jgi:chemotaxis signal transduction protein
MSNTIAAGAWLLDLGVGIHVAVGERELQYLLPDLPKFTTIPNAPSYCCKAFVWQGDIIPVVDIAQLILGQEITRLEQEELIVLAIFQSNDNTLIQRGALFISAIPSKIYVQDQQTCDFPPPQALWQQLSSSCFNHSEIGAVPILNLEKIFLTTATSLWSKQGVESFAS